MNFCTVQEKEWQIQKGRDGNAIKKLIENLEALKLLQALRFNVEFVDFLAKLAHLNLKTQVLRHME